jgi:ParB-like chromosome segregation protein Spo0J
MANSFKQMIKGKVISRSDSGMFISLDDIHVKPGFNKRDDSERLRKANDELFAYLMNGGPVPALEVVARDEGGVWLIEGHRRRQAYERCRQEGKPVDRIQIMPFVGNDVQRLARIMTSNNQLALEPLEQAALIQEMATVFNLTPAEIAKLVHLSVPKVKELLALSTANHDVQQKVKAGEVAVNVAVDRVKEHGDKAGEVLEKDKAVAAAAGKKKVTRSVLNPELSIKKARRLVALLSAALGSDNELEFEPEDWEELLRIINEHRVLSATETKESEHAK